MDDFAEVIDTRTGLKQRVPAAWLNDPILGRFITKSPSQRALDGELGQAPTDDSKVSEIRSFAEQAEIDVTGLTKKDELLAAVRAVVGTDPLPVGASPGDVAVQANPVGADPTTDPSAGPADGTTTSTTDTPAAGDKE